MFVYERVILHIKYNNLNSVDRHHTQPRGLVPSSKHIALNKAPPLEQTYKM